MLLAFKSGSTFTFKFKNTKSYWRIFLPNSSPVLAGASWLCGTRNNISFVPGPCVFIKTILLFLALEVPR
jgi:hypothetical protein